MSHIDPPDVHQVAATTHGRYLVSRPAVSPAAALFGFHGYGEDAAAMLERLRDLPGQARWLLVSVQALHPFYARTRRVVASWMTQQDRELAIADNLAYVSGVVESVIAEYRLAGAIAYAGFSQGVAMAFRAAALTGARCDGVIALGGDVPPELGAGSLGRIRAALIGRGRTDEWYRADAFEADRGRLESAGVTVTPVELDAGHDWTTPFAETAGRFLTSISVT